MGRERQLYARQRAGEGRKIERRLTLCLLDHCSTPLSMSSTLSRHPIFTHSFSDSAKPTFFSVNAGQFQTVFIRVYSYDRRLKADAQCSRTHLILTAITCLPAILSLSNILIFQTSCGMFRDVKFIKKRLLLVLKKSKKGVETFQHFFLLVENQLNNLTLLTSN